jgi:hypothetical protein
LAALPKSWGIAPVQQSDRLVEFTAEARARATILSASSGNKRSNAFASHPMTLASKRPYLVCRVERDNSSAASAYAATSRPSDIWHI